MKRNWFIGISILLLLIVAGACWGWFPTREATYNGRTASAWLEEVWTPGLTYGPGSRRPTQAENDVARNAIRAMGANALPTIIGMLQCRDSDARRKFVRLMSKQKFVKFHFRPPSEELNLRGIEGVRILGTNGAPAVPALARCLANTNLKGRYNGFIALRSVGSAATNVLSQLIDLAHSDPSAGIRSSALDTLLSLHLSTDIIFPVITNALADTDAGIQDMAVYQVLGMKVDPPTLVPLLVKQLDGSNAYVSCVIMRELPSLGKPASAAVPGLERLLKSDDLNTRLSARATLDKIQGTKTPSSTTEVASYEYNFHNTPVYQVLDEYKELVGKPIRRKGFIPPSTMIQIFTVRKLTKSEATAVVKSALENQGHLTLTPTTDGAIEVERGR